MKERLLGAYTALLDVLFPIACVSCGAGGAWFCQACETSVPSEPGRCIRCGKRSLHGITCAPCRIETPLEGVAAVGTYRDEVLRSAVHALKFSGVRDLAGPLSDLLARRIVAAGLHRPLPGSRVTGLAGPGLASTNEGKGGASEGGTVGSPPVLVPLPLHPRRERARGFNQAALLADGLEKRLSLPVRHLLRRTRSTSPQTSIDAHVQDRRRFNVAGAFTFVGDTDSAAPSHVLLVDDVTTTGATLEEAARVLYHHGARTIWGAVICRG